MSASSVISLISSFLIVYLFCKHKQIRTLMTSLILHKIKNVEASSNETNSECKTLAYTGITLTILSLIIVTFLHYKKSRLCKGHKFSNVVKIMLFISDIQNYVPIKLCKTAGSIHLFKIKGRLKPEDMKLNENYLWDTLEIDWKDVTVTFNNNKINLPRIVVVRLHDKIKVNLFEERKDWLLPPNYLDNNAKGTANVTHPEPPIKEEPKLKSNHLLVLKQKSVDRDQIAPSAKIKRKKKTGMVTTRSSCSSNCSPNKRFR